MNRVAFSLSVICLSLPACTAFGKTNKKFSAGVRYHTEDIILRLRKKIVVITRLTQPLFCCIFATVVVVVNGSRLTGSEAHPMVS